MDANQKEKVANLSSVQKNLNQMASPRGIEPRSTV